MSKTDKDTIKEIESILKKRKEKPKATVSTEDIAEDVVSKLLKQLQTKPETAGSVPAAAVVAGPAGPGPVAGSQMPQPNLSQEKYKMAQMTMKLAKNISILCMLIFIIPVVSILVTMMDLEMAALVVAMMAMIYPAFLFVQSLGMQTYLSKKYGLRPLMRMPPQQMMPGSQGQPYRKQNKEFF